MIVLASFACVTWTVCDLYESCSFGSRKKLVSVNLARLSHITKRQVVARQCHDGNTGLSAQVCSAKEKKALHLVQQSYSLLGQLSYVALYLQGIVVEFLTLLPARSTEGILQSIEEFRFVLTLERVR